jgi:hypothetical protein
MPFNFMIFKIWYTCISFIDSIYPGEFEIKGKTKSAGADPGICFQEGTRPGQFRG